jgi:hypothetical protein
MKERRQRRSTEVQLMSKGSKYESYIGEIIRLMARRDKMCPSRHKMRIINKQTPRPVRCAVTDNARKTNVCFIQNCGQ